MAGQCADRNQFHRDLKRERIRELKHKWIRYYYIHKLQNGLLSNYLLVGITHSSKIIPLSLRDVNFMSEYGTGDPDQQLEV